MRLLLDEDSQGRLFVRLLKASGFDLETVSDADLTGKPDADVLAYARASGRVLLTRNGKDFLELHAADDNHPGILIEYQDADPGKNMTMPQIVEAITKIASSGWDISGQCVGINAWR
jgi:predicted nuclease of predicted toxin-antitoxin system